MVTSCERLRQFGVGNTRRPPTQHLPPTASIPDLTPRGHDEGEAICWARQVCVLACMCDELLPPFTRDCDTAKTGVARSHATPASSIALTLQPSGHAFELHVPKQEQAIEWAIPWPLTCSQSWPRTHYNHRNFTAADMSVDFPSSSTGACIDSEHRRVTTNISRAILDCGQIGLFPFDPDRNLGEANSRMRGA